MNEKFIKVEVMEVKEAVDELNKLIDILKEANQLLNSLASRNVDLKFNGIGILNPSGSEDDSNEF